MGHINHNRQYHFEIRRRFKDRIPRVIIALVFAFIIIYSLSSQSGSPLSSNDSKAWAQANFGNAGGVTRLSDVSADSGDVVDPLKPRSEVGKVHAVFGEPNPVYERALKLHQVHATAQGHPMHVLRERVLSGLWSKPAYILSIMLQELAKPEEVRLKWLLYVISQQFSKVRLTG